MKIQSLPTTPSTRTAAPPVGGPPSPDPEPQDSSRLSIAHQNGLYTTSSWNEKAGMAVGGAIGLGTVIPGLYAGIIGGTIGGGIAGLGFGPAVGVIKGAEGLSFLGEIFNTGGAVAKAAIVAGTACAAVGGFVVGKKVGQMVSGVPVSLVAYPWGFVSGLVSGEAPPESQTRPAPPEQVQLIKRRGGFARGAQGFLGGVGMLTGGLGGAAVGAGIAGGATLVSGLIARDLTLSALGVSGAIGAGVGAVLGGAISGFGGYAIVGGVADTASWLKSKVAPDKEGERLQELSTQVAERRTQFESLGERLDQATEGAAADFRRRRQELSEGEADTSRYEEGRELEMGELRQQSATFEREQIAAVQERRQGLEQRDQAIEKVINRDADGRFAAKRVATDAKYAELHAELDRVRERQQQRDDAISESETTQAQLIESRVVASYDQKMVPVQQRYEGLHREQDQREAGFDTWDSNIRSENAQLDQTIADQGLANYKERQPALEAEFRHKEKELRADYGARTDAADQRHQEQIQQADHRQRQQIESADQGHEQAMRRADSDHDQAMREARSGHQQAMTSEDQRHQRAMSELEDEFEDRDKRLESGHRKTMATLTATQATLQGRKSELEREKPGLERDLRSAKSDLDSAESQLRDARRRWDSEVGQAESDRDRAVSERNTLKRQLAEVEERIRQAEADKSKWVRQKAQIDANLSGLRSERDRLKRELDKLK